MAQSELAKDFVKKLQVIMEYNTETQQEQIIDNIASLCTYLRNLEHSQKLKKQSPYEKRKFNQDFQYMQNQLAAVRKVKVIRKTFKFSSRKYIQQQVEKKEEVQQEVEYDTNRLIKDVKDQIIDLTKPYKDITPEDLTNSDINIQNVSGCTIILPDIQIVYISNISNCKLLTGKISSAFHCEGARNCQLEVSAHQFRIHQSINCIFSIEAGSAPIIENCNMLKFKARRTNYFGKENAEKWKEIRNFTFLKNQKDPNYDIIEE